MATGTEVGSIYYDLNLDTQQFQQQMDAAKAKAGTFGDSLESIGSSISSVGKTLLPFSTAAAAALGYSVKAAISFDQQMELLHTQAGDTQQQVEDLTPKVEALASQVGFSPTSLATALYHVASVGNGIWSVSQQMNILQIAAEGAAVGQADLNDTTYALTSTMSSGIQGAQTAGEAMGTLNAIVGAGDMHMQDLNGALSTGILSASKTFGVSLSSMGAALATLTDNGEPAQQAATRLSMGMALMAAPSTAAAKVLAAVGLQGPAVTAASDAMTQALQKSGVSTTKLADDLRQPNGFLVAMEDLKTHLMDAGLSSDDAAATMSRAFGGGRTDKALMTLFGNLDRLQVKFASINKNANDFGQDWASQQETAKQKMDDFKATIDVVGVALGNAFLPILESLASSIGKIAEGFSGLSGGTQKFIVIVVAIIAVLGPLLIILGSIFTAVGVLMSPVTLIVIGIAAFGAAVAYVIDKTIGFKKVMQDLGGFLRDVETALGFIGAALTGADPTVGAVGEHWVAFTRALTPIQDLSLRIQAMVHMLIENLPQAVAYMEAFIRSFMHSTPVVILGQFITQVFVPALKAIGESLVKDLLPALGQLWSSVMRIWEALNPALMDALKIVGAILFGLMLASIWAVYAAFNAFIHVVAFVASALSDVIKWIADLISWFGNLVGVVWNTIKTIGDIFANLVPAVKIVIGLVIQAFGTAGSMLYDVGKAIVQGLINGVEAMADKVKSAVEGVGNDIKNVAKKILGVFSPSVVFAEIGQNVGQGLANGIGSMANTVSAATKQMTTSSLTAMQTQATATVDHMKKTVGQLQGLSQQATAITTGATNTGSNVTKFANVNFGNASFNFANTQDVDYFMQKLGRNVQLASQGLTGLR